MPIDSSAEESKRRTYSPVLLLIALAVIIVALAAFFIATPIGTHTGRQGTTSQAPASQQ